MYFFEIVDILERAVLLMYTGRLEEAPPLKKLRKPSTLYSLQATLNTRKIVVEVEVRTHVLML